MDYDPGGPCRIRSMRASCPSPCWKTSIASQVMPIRQERVPIAYRARVFGALTTLSFIAIPLGQLLGGYVVEWIGVQAALGAALSFISRSW
jgi:hypothetical protein